MNRSWDTAMLRHTARTAFLALFTLTALALGAPGPLAAQQAAAQRFWDRVQSQHSISAR